MVGRGDLSKFFFFSSFKIDSVPYLKDKVLNKKTIILASTVIETKRFYTSKKDFNMH